MSLIKFQLTFLNEQKWSQKIRKDKPIKQCKLHNIYIGSGMTMN